nr:hypothetical protein [Tanacetum cinerariifolium]
MERATQEAKLNAHSKHELIKVVEEVATEAEVDPKVLRSSKGGQEFLQKQDVKLSVLQREHMEKLKKERELKRKRINQYIYGLPITNQSLRRSLTFTFIQTQNKFGDFGVTEWDESGAIIPKKKNKVVEYLMNSLCKKYERLKETPSELEIKSTLPPPEKVPSLSLSRKRKALELEPNVCIPSLECNRSLPEGV